MFVIEPVQITDDNLYYSSVPLNDYPQWNVGTTYAAEDRVMVLATKRLYESVSGSTGIDPATDDGTNWIDIGANNRWKAFDKLLSDPVIADERIHYTFEPTTACDSVALFNLEAAELRLVCTDANEGVLYDEKISMVDNTMVVDGYSYCFEPIVQQSTVVVDGLPIYAGVKVAVRIDSDDEVRVGQIVLGKARGLGTTLTGTSLGIEDFSRKERDPFGNAILVERAFAQTTQFNFSFPTDAARRVMEVLSRIRATPSVYYIGSDASQYGVTVYGFFRDINVPLTTSVSFATLEVEGLT